MTVLRIAVCALLLPGLLPLAHPQSAVRAPHPAIEHQEASLEGSVSDPTGALLPDATVTLHAVDEAKPRSQPSPEPDRITHTSRFGHFDLAGVSGQTYILTVSAPGFATFVTPELTLSPGSPHLLNVQLHLADHSEQIFVSDTNALDPERNGDALVLSGRDVDGLPHDSAQLLEQLQALAGGPAPQMYVDGYSNATLPPLDSIRDIRINQNPYSARNDTNPASGQIEIFTRPGSARFHGDLYTYGDGSALNTRNPFVPQQQPYHFLFFNAGLSGPLGKHASFFFDSVRQSAQVNALINARTLDANALPLTLLQSLPAPSTVESASPRIDLALGRKSIVVLRYSVTRSTQTNGGVGELALASQAYDSQNVLQTIQFSDSQIVTAKIINDTRFQYQRSRVRQTPASSAPTIVVPGSFTGGGNAGGAYNDNQDRYELQNYWSASVRNQFLNFGGRLRFTRDANHSLANYNGTFTYASLMLAPDCTLLTTCHSYQVTQQMLARAASSAASVIAAGGGASQFTLTQGNPNVTVDVLDTGLFFQDDWRAHPSLLLSGGLRFETQTHIADHADFAPRFGFAWSVGATSNRPARTIVRGGAGIFYSRLTSGYVLQATRQNGINQRQFVVDSPSFFDTASASGLTPGTAAIYEISPTFRAPYTLSSTLGIERQIRDLGSITLTFLNTRGVHQLLTRNRNAPLPGTYSAANPDSGVRPSGTPQNIYDYESAGLSRGNRLTASFFFRKQRYTLYGFYMLNFQSSTAVAGFVSAPYNIRSDYGRADADIRHQGNLGGTVLLPHGFHSDFYLRATSGAPFNITLGQDLNGDSIFNDRPAFATDLSRPSVVGTAYGTFDTAPLPGQTIIPINLGNGPSQFFLNLGLNRTFTFGPALIAPAGPSAVVSGPQPRIHRRFSLDVGVSAQNLFNHVNASQPIGILGSPLFGHSLALSNATGSTSANRVINLEADVRF